jgi:hypothetical protein
MNNAFRQNLLVSWHPVTDILNLSVSEVSATGGAAIDGVSLAEELWTHYSTEATKRFRRAFSDEILLASGLPFEIIENHLLVDIYRPSAFPALLAERLARPIAKQLLVLRRTQPAPLHCAVLLSPLMGAPETFLPLLERELRRELNHESTERTSGRFPGGRGGSFIKAWSGFLLGVTGTVLSLIRVAVSVRAGLPGKTSLPDHLFVLFGGKGNHTCHVQEWLAACARPSQNMGVLLLGNKSLGKEIMRDCSAAGIPVVPLIKIADVPRAILSLFHHWKHLSDLTHKAEQDLGVRCDFEFHARAAAWWLRGLLHEACVRELKFGNAANTLAIFGLIAHADTRYADQTLRTRGVKTVHWLHGIVEDSLHYRANSTACLCQNEADADLRARHGRYGACLVARSARGEFGNSKPATDKSVRRGALLVTNLIHPDNRFARTGAHAALRELLHVVAKHFAGTEVRTLTWRPHPRELETAQFPKFERLAESLGFEVDNAGSLAQQTGRHKHLISTFSGSIGDAAEAGTVPAVFAGLPYETDGHWGKLPDEIKFRTAEELGAVLERLADERSARQWQETLCAQYGRPVAMSKDIQAVWERIRGQPIDAGNGLGNPGKNAMRFTQAKVPDPETVIKL